MLWYNILNPRAWPGVSINTGNNKIDGIYYNLLSSNHISLAASGSMFLASNSGIKLISPSFVETSGFRANTILSENFGKVNNSGQVIPLYSGQNSGLIFKEDDNTLISSDIISYDSENNFLKFSNASDGSLLYIVPSYINGGQTVPANKQISFFDGIQIKPADTIVVNNQTQVSNPANISFSVKLNANSGISLGPNNNLNSYSGFILTHDGSGNVAQWKPATYLRENYNTDLAFDGLERIGVNWIRYPKRPAIISNGKLYLYKNTKRRSWSPYESFSDVDQIIRELGDGTDTLCVETAQGEIVVGYTKFAFVEKASSQQILMEEFGNLTDRIEDTTVIDPDNTDADETEAPAWAIEIAPENPGNISDGTGGGSPTNVFVFSVTKGAYFPMQLEPDATGPIRIRDSSGAIFSGEITKNDDGTLLDTAINVPLTFKPNTSNNISTRPNIHTSFNMLGENIDFLIYGKEKTLFNNYSDIFDLNENFVPTGLTPIFKVDANIPNSVLGSPTGVLFSKFIDRNKQQPIGWSFDNSGKVCIKSNNSYVLASIPSGTGSLESHADLTVNGHTYTNSLITQDIYLKPIPNRENTNKYKRNALLTVDSNGKIISRSPRINPTTPSAPTMVSGVNNGYSGRGNLEHSIIWNAPDDDGRSKIINYSIQLSYNDGETWLSVPDNTISVLRGFASQTSATIQQIPPVSVIFRVAAQNNIGIGLYSEPTDTFNNNDDVPRVPLGFTQNRNIDSIDQSDITLSWMPTSSWGSSPGKEYKIEESSNDGIDWYTITTIPYDEDLDDPGAALRTYTETGLDGITNYLYRISAINISGGISAYNYVYSTGLVLIDPDLEEEENRRQDELSNFDFNNILFTGICNI